ncbi:MAG: hypothetical protein AAGG57_05315 [Pseudomonadota bacterium]
MDVFVVGQGGGQDVVQDVRAEEGEKTSLNYLGINSFPDLQQYLSDDEDEGTMISFPDGGSVHLKWVPLNALGEDQFIFEGGPICFFARDVDQYCHRPAFC